MDPETRAKELWIAKPPKRDYLKYYRLVRYWARAYSGLAQAEIEMLMYLYSETFFDRKKFDEYCKVMGWNRSRFQQMRDGGWIDVWRERRGRQRTLYKMSIKARNFIGKMYDYLEGEPMPTTGVQNPMFTKKAAYSMKRARNLVEHRNTHFKEQRQRPSQK